MFSILLQSDRLQLTAGLLQPTGGVKTTHRTAFHPRGRSAPSVQEHEGTTHKDLSASVGLARAARGALTNWKTPDCADCNNRSRENHARKTRLMTDPSQMHLFVSAFFGRLSRSELELHSFATFCQEQHRLTP